MYKPVSVDGMIAGNDRTYIYEKDLILLRFLLFIAPILATNPAPISSMKT